MRKQTNVHVASLLFGLIFRAAGVSDGTQWSSVTTVTQSSLSTGEITATRLRTLEEAAAEVKRKRPASLISPHVDEEFDDIVCANPSTAHLLFENGPLFEYSGLNHVPTVTEFRECAAACCADMACLVWQWHGQIRGCWIGLPTGIYHGSKRVVEAAGHRERRDADTVLCVAEKRFFDSVSKIAAVLNDASRAGVLNDAYNRNGGTSNDTPVDRYTPYLARSARECEEFGRMGYLGRIDFACHAKQSITMENVADRCSIHTTAVLAKVAWIHLVVGGILPFFSESSRGKFAKMETFPLIRAFVIADEQSFSESTAALLALGLDAHRVPPAAPPEGVCSGREKETGCSLAHRAAWKAASMHNSSSVVLERDWALVSRTAPADARRHLAAAAFDNPEASITYLGHCHQVLCSHAYMLGPGTANALLESWKPPCIEGMPLDYVLAEHCVAMFPRCRWLDGGQQPGLFGEGLLQQNRTRFTDQIHNSPI